MTKKTSIQESIMLLNIIDDPMFEKMAEDIGFCEEVISTVLGQKVRVISVTPQKSIKNLQGRSVVLDVLCELEDGRRCNIEMQKANDDDHEKRVRYNTSCITANITDTGIKFEKVPDIISIFISKFDIFQEGKTVYHIDRTIRETGKISDNGLQEIYVNTKIDDGSDIAQLMRIFKEQNTYDFEKFPKTSKRKQYLMKNEGGRNNMHEAVVNYAKQYAKEVEIEKAKEIARNFLEKGVDYEMVRMSIDSLSDEELMEIYNDVTSKK